MGSLRLSVWSRSEASIVTKRRDRGAGGPVTHMAAAPPLLCEAVLRAISPQEMKFTF